MKHTAFSLNREIVAPEIDSPELWLHLVPRGDFPGILCAPGDASHEIIQRCDDAALRAIVSNFAAPALVDFEHRSLNPAGDTSAAGWIRELNLRADGIWGLIELSGPGRDAVRNKSYRHLSPSLHISPGEIEPNVFRPFNLISAALTNRPNLKDLKPISNKASEPESPDNNTNMADQAGKETMQEIATALGLPADADAQKITEAIAALNAQLETLKRQLADVEKAQVEKEADDFVAANSALISDKNAVRAQFVANSAAVKSLFVALAAATPPPPATHNRAAASTPVATSADKALQQQAAVMLVQNREKCDYKKAFNIARRENSSLFSK